MNMTLSTIRQRLSVCRFVGFPNRQTAKLSNILLVLAATASPALAQLGSHNPMPGPRGVYAITNAKIVTVSGAEIPRGTVVVGAEGKIAAVGANVAVPAGARTIDAANHTVYPGMFDAG